MAVSEGGRVMESKPKTPVTLQCASFPVFPTRRRYVSCFVLEGKTETLLGTIVTVISEL